MKRPIHLPKSLMIGFLKGKKHFISGHRGVTPLTRLDNIQKYLLSCVVLAEYATEMMIWNEWADVVDFDTFLDITKEQGRAVRDIHQWNRYKSHIAEKLRRGDLG